MADKSGDKGHTSRRRSCEQCRQRRKRCIPSSIIEGRACGPCERCIKLDQAAICEFSSPGLFTGRPPVDSGGSQSYGTVATVPMTPSSILSRGHFEETLVRFEDASLMTFGACIDINQLYGLFDLWMEYEKTISKEGLGGAIILRTSSDEDIISLTNTYCAICAFASGSSYCLSDQMSRCWNWVNLALRIGTTLVNEWKKRGQHATEAMCMASMHLFSAVMYSKFPAHASMDQLVNLIRDLETILDKDDLRTWDYCEMCYCNLDLCLMRLEGIFERGRAQRIESFEKYGNNMHFRKLHSISMEIVVQAFVVYNALGQVDLSTGAMSVDVNEYDLDNVHRSQLIVLVEDMARILHICEVWLHVAEIRRCRCLLMLHLAYALFIVDRENLMAAEYARSGLNVWLEHGEKCHPANALSSNEYLMGIAVLEHLDPGWVVTLVTLRRPSLLITGTLEHFSVRACQNVLKLSKMFRSAMVKVKSRHGGGS